MVAGVQGSAASQPLELQPVHSSQYTSLRPLTPPGCAIVLLCHLPQANQLLAGASAHLWSFLRVLHASPRKPKTCQAQTKASHLGA